MQAPSRPLIGAAITLATLIVCFMGIRYELDAARKSGLRAVAPGSPGTPRTPALSANRDSANDSF